MVGELTTIASTNSAGEIAYKTKTRSVHEFMKYYDVPAAMRKGIRGFYSRTWQRSIYFDKKAILTELPINLRKDLSLYLMKGIVSKVPFLQGADNSMISMLVCALSLRMCAPREIIIKQGDFGSEMYFIDVGELEVLFDDEVGRLSVL
jgi:CRP-like cAMP-binding protein